MNVRSGGNFARHMAVAVMVLLMAAGFASAQTATGILRGQVTDPSGAQLVGATVLLTTPSGGSMDTTTNKDGVYEFPGLAAGTYELKAVAKGFALFSKPGVKVEAGQTVRVNIALSLEMQQEKVMVNDTTTQVDINPANNANTIVLQGKDLEALSDDPDELQSELEALAGPSAGPNGGQIYIDGFTAGQLPPKASIREIRINQNPFSSEYDKLGYGRVEIFTKPGTDKLHGQLMIMGNTAGFNARNPFEVLPAGSNPPAYHSEQFSGNLGGAINKKTSFFFNVEQRDIGALGVVSGTVICGDPYLQIPCPAGQTQFSQIPFSAAVANPQTRTNASPRIDYQLTPANTLTVRYQYWRNSETNNNVGQFSLAPVGTNELETEHTLQLTDTQTVNPSTINEFRFQFHRDNDLNTPVKTLTNINVGGAFNSVGSGGGNVSDVQSNYEFQDILYKTFRKHSVKFGGRVRSTFGTNSTAASFNGSFIFGAQSQLGCIQTPATPCPTETPIEVYQTTIKGLAAGLTIPEIQQTYGFGGANYYSQTAGIPATSVTWVDVGIFAQDDWKVRPNVTVSYGLRFESQNNFSDKADFAPRIGAAWGIGGNAKNPPKTVLRGGFGMFYDRFSSNLLLTEDRFNIVGGAQHQYLIQNPNFFLAGNVDAICTPPLPTPPPAQCLGSSLSSPATVYQSNSNLHAPYTMQTGVTLERQLTKAANLAVTYLNSRGVHQFYTNNINPQADPNAPAYTPPVPGQGNIYQYQSEGIFKQNQVIVNGSIRMGTKLTLFGYYTLNYAKSDTSGAGSIPSNPFDLQQDYGRASFDVRHRLFLGGSIGAPYGFRFSPFLIASSSLPFNITTGTDPYLDSVYNTRPAFATTCAPAGQTKYGCFDAAPAAGYTPIPINYGDGPGRFSLNLRVSKTFGFGPVLESAGGGQGGGMAGGTFGRGPGGPGRGGPQGGRGMDAGATNRRYALTVGVVGRNIFNNVNVMPPIGNLSSPLFGESNGLAGRPYGDGTSNRRLDLQLTFTF